MFNTVFSRFGALETLVDTILHGMWTWLKEWGPYFLPAVVTLLLVLAGILLSFQTLIEKIEERPKLRGICVVVFVGLGVIGFWFDVTERHRNDKANHELIGNVQKELRETDALLNEVRNVEIYAAMMPTVNAKIDTLQKQMFTARERHDPTEISKLQRQLADEEKVKSLLSRQILSNAGRSIGQLKDIVRYWNAEREHAKDAIELQRVDEMRLNTSSDTIANARAVTGQLLSLLPEITAEDRLEDSVFYGLLRNGSNPEGIQRVAAYMDALAKRVSAANPELAK